MKLEKPRFDLKKSQQMRGTTTCGPDSLQYALFKANGLQGLRIYNASATGAGQYFDNPGTVSISGFSFYGYSIDTSIFTVPLTCAIYQAGPDSLPMGGPLATTTFNLDTTFGTGALSTLRRNVNFSAPVSVTGAYIVAYENGSSNQIVGVCNDFNGPDGAGEYLGVVRLGTAYTQGYNVAIGAVPFDADWLIEPHVTYDLTASFNSVDCYEVGTAVTLTNTSSAFNGNRMYSVPAAFGLEQIQYTWDFGDGSPAVNAIDTFATYGTGGMSYTVSLTDSLFGWTVSCVSDTSKTLSEGVPPSAGFTSMVGAGNDVTFTNTSTGTTPTYAWDFGDGGSSTMENPVYTYAAAGTYTVCLTVTDACGSITFCDVVNVNAVSIESELANGIQLFPNPAQSQIFVALDLANEADVTLNIYNVHGAKMQSRALGLVQQAKVALDLNTLANGIYYLEVRNGSERAVKRFNIAR